MDKLLKQTGDLLQFGIKLMKRFRLNEITVSAML